MTRHTFPRALSAAFFSLALLFLAGCTTVETRIQEKPQAFQSLSANDQRLVQQGKIREGLSKDAVYIAWGPPSQRVPGRNRGRVVETWVYDSTAAGDYLGPYGYGYGYGGFGYGGFGYGGFGYGGGFYGRRHGRFGRFYYDPFYDPFFYNHANIVRYPERIVSFQNGRVISFQFLPMPRFY